MVHDYSCSTWIYILKIKSDTRTLLQYFIVMVETPFNSNIKTIGTDNGSEFAMLQFYSSKSIQHQQSCVAIPQQNSIMEMSHQHSLDVARALLFQSNLSLIFWTDCVFTTIYLTNRILSPPILSKKSPYEMLFNKLPSYTHVKVFGCLCYASIIAHNRSKFDYRARRCTFLGYPLAIKGYKLYDFDSCSTFISRDVIFYEHIFSFQSISHNLKTFHEHSSAIFPQPNLEISQPTA